MTWYAWAPIRYGAETDENGVVTKTLTRGVGKEVTKGGLDMSDADWDYLVATGSIREEEYPVPNQSGSSVESPREVIIRRAAEAMRQAQEGMNLTGKAEPVPE
jgi:hypothetical protein